jgi:GGDEF domain-containing protein
MSCRRDSGRRDAHQADLPSDPAAGAQVAFLGQTLSGGDTGSEGNSLNGAKLYAFSVDKTQRYEMISIARFLSFRPQKADHTDCCRALQLLLHGLALHAIEGPQKEYQEFRRTMFALYSGIIEDTETPDSIMGTVSAALQTLAEYSMRTSAQLQSRQAELKSVISLLAQGVATLAAKSTESVDRLKELEQRLISAHDAADVRDIKSRLSNCITELNSEIEVQERRTDGDLRSLQDGIADAHRFTAVDGDVDPVTGLPGVQNAEADIELLAKEGTPAHIAVFVIRRLQQISARYGYAAGDEVLAYFATYLGSALPATDVLFRWHGPSFLAVLRRSEPEVKLQQEIRRVVHGVMEHEFNLKNRVAVVPIACSWAMFPAGAPIAVFRKQVQQFVASEGNEPCKVQAIRPIEDLCRRA